MREHHETDNEHRARILHPSAALHGEAVTPGPPPVGSCCAACASGLADPLTGQATVVGGRNALSLLNAQAVRPTNHGTAGRPGRFARQVTPPAQVWRRVRETMDAPPLGEAASTLPGRALYGSGE